MTYIHAPVRVILQDRNEVRVEIDNSERVVPIPSGAQGLPGEVLKKRTNTDYDTYWANESGGVTSVNGQTGAVILDADDVGALPDDTFIPTKTSDLTNDSGFVNATQAASAAPVQSVNGQTGAVTTPVTPLSDATPSPLGTASAGTSSDASRSDHVHAMPSASDVGALPVPTIVEDVWDTTQGGSAYYDSTATFTVVGNGFVIAQDNTWNDQSSTSDYGSSDSIISYNGTVVAVASVRTTSGTTERQGSFVEYPANVSNGDIFVMTERHTKAGTKHVRRRFVCFGCTVTKTA